MIATLPARRDGLRRVAVVLGGAGLAAAAAGAGVVLGVVGLRFGVVPVLGLAVAAVAVAAAVARPDLALLLVPLALPVGTRQVPGLPLRVVQVSIVAAVGLATFARGLHGRRAFAWPPPLRWAAAFVAALVPAMAFAVDIATAVNQLVLVGFGLLLASSLAACDSDHDVELLTVGFVAFGAAICATTLPSIGGLQSHFGAALVENRAQGTFAQPNDLGTLANLVLFVSLGLVVSARRTSGQIASGVAALMGLAALVLSLSRGSWIGAALAAVALLVVLPGGRRRLVAFGLVVVVVLLAMAALQQQGATSVVTERLGKLLNHAANPYDNRPQIYRQALHVIETHPLLGVGPGGFYRETLAPDAVTGSSADHAHDVLLTVSAEAGLPAAGLLVGFTLALALATLRAVRGRGPLGDRRLLAALGCALVAIVGQGLVDFTLRNPVLLTLVWFVVGLMLARIPRCAHRSRDPLPIERRALEIGAAQR
jgi:putative inorganic carbon (hco3(-)) transporter